MPLNFSFHVYPSKSGILYSQDPALRHVSLQNGITSNQSNYLIEIRLTGITPARGINDVPRCYAAIRLSCKTHVGQQVQNTQENLSCRKNNGDNDNP